MRSCGRVIEREKKIVAPNQMGKITNHISNFTGMPPNPKAPKPAKKEKVFDLDSR